jgi:UDP-N-acetylmuramate dehydrogenase
VEDIRDAQVAAAARSLPFVVLGGGSNVLPLPKVRQFVCLQALRGVELLEDTDDFVRIRVGAGENWHAIVIETLRKGWYGLENMALIPGSVGAAPVQNIGAYGVELASFVERVNVLTEQGEQVSMHKAQCRFAYRDSVFKVRRQLVILSVELRLSKRPQPSIEYPDLVAEMQNRDPLPRNIADAVIAIRQRKLPDPAMTPNAGSFFKNPIVEAAAANQLATQHSGMSIFLQDDGRAKLSAAQLIDRAGWKDRGTDKVRCWPTQPLVLTNVGGADANDVLAFANAICDDIRERFGVQLELEPCVLS